MHKFIYRLINACTVFYAAFKSPEVIRPANLKALVSLWDLILKVVTDKRSYLAKVGVINTLNNNILDVATIWCGYGADAAPSLRITELCNENAALKLEIKNLVKMLGESNANKG